MSRWIPLLFVLGLIHGISADEPLALDRGFVLLKLGAVEVEGSDGKKRKFERNSEGDPMSAIVIREGETARTGEGADCSVLFPELGSVKLQPKTAIKIPVADVEGDKQPASLQLLSGKLFLDVDGKKLAKDKKSFRLKTPTVILAVKGTRFFADAVGEVETAGVHEGEVVMVENDTGKFETLRTGSAAMAKPGALTKPRRLTAEEQAYTTIYKDFALAFSPAERPRRKYVTSYRVFDDPNTAVPSEHPNKIEVKPTVGEDATSALEITVLPFPEAPDVSIFGRLQVELPFRVEGEPGGFVFSARGIDVRRFTVSGGVEWEGKTYRVPSGWLAEFPEETLPEEWVHFFVPLGAVEEEWAREDIGSVSFHINPNLHEGRAIESIVNVEMGKPKYVLEVSPVQLGVRPKE